MSSHTIFFFVYNETATTQIYPLSLHDALPISARRDPAVIFFIRSVGPQGHEELFPPRRAGERATVQENNFGRRSEEHTSELQSLTNLVCRLLLEKKKRIISCCLDATTLIKAL